MSLSPDEESIMNTCITGSTPREIADYTALPISKVRRLLKSMRARQLIRPYTFKPFRSGRSITVWNRDDEQTERSIR